MKAHMINVSEQPTSYGLLSEDTGNNRTGMGWFKAFRGDFGYSHYGEHRTSVTADIPFAAITYTCVLISIASLIAAAGIRGKERWYTLARMVYSLAVGSVILVSLFGYCWQLGDVGVHSVYIYGRESYMEGTVGVRVGLRTVNLTLTGRVVEQGSSFSYNEELVLLDVIHKPHKLWSALDRGLPQPLLSVLEHFDTDDGGLRFGRSCWLAGYITNILLWSAFAFWVTGNILLCSIVWYGAACFTLTGVCMILAPVLYNALCPQTQLKMPCSDHLLQLSYGWCFWSTLVFGILTTLVGLALFLLDQKVPKKLAEFFLLDVPLEEPEEPRLYPALSTPPSRPDTPDKHLAMVVDKRAPLTGTPVNWYDNFACEPTAKGNPVFDDTRNDISPPDHVNQSTPRARAYSDIKEEVEQRNSLELGANEETPDEEEKAVSIIDRMSQIYVDVEPSYSMSSHSLNSSLRSQSPLPK